MPKLNQYEAICRALESRGELRDREARTTKYAVFTRTYAGARDASGALRVLPNPSTSRWLVGKGGALRMLRICGSLRITDSIPAQPAVKNLLIAEGRLAPNVPR